MDNLGDWLYIVFIAIAAISSLFSGKKKKQTVAKPAQPRGTSETSTENEPKKSFWDILEEMNEEPKRPMPRSQKAPEKKTVPPKKTTVNTAPSPFLGGETVQSSVSTPLKQSNLLIEDNEDTARNITSEDFHLQDVDEVRKAIIYSEILNRKY